MSFLCPVCKSKLLWGGSAIYQTTCEHVENPNWEPPSKPFYYCNNEFCDANAPEETLTRYVLIEKLKKTNPNSLALFWDEEGALYGNKKEIKFIDNNEGPFGSFERKFNVEHRKKDENRTIFNAFGIRIDIEYIYTSDTDGNILRRRSRVQVFRKCDLGYTYVNSPFSGLRYYRRVFKNNLSNFRENKSVFSGRKINEIIKTRHKTSSSIVFSIYIKIFYPMLVYKLKDKKYHNDLY